ncbi:hypothetical protein B0H14DRAFT_1564484 [Mycena olivaceomarginata]|nr:hypothetical protein B0H14DRAFT_1564484 [Mycena olivaceomarginata]
MPSRCSIGPSSLTAPLLLLKICKRWRDIALRTPALWASFAVHSGSGRAFGSMGSDHLPKWLQRAGAAPLNLRLTYQGHGSSSFPDGFFQIFDHASQWRRVHLAVPFGCFSQPRVQEALRGTFTSLEELSLNPLPPNYINGLALHLRYAPHTICEGAEVARGLPHQPPTLWCCPSLGTAHGPHRLRS